MSFWSVLGDIFTGGIGSSLVSGLFGTTSAKMEYSQTKEGQERQYGYNTKLNKQQYKYQKKLNADQFGYQKQLNKTALDYQRLLNQEANNYSRGLMQYEQQLTTAQNQWNATQLPSLTRQGYENAGINPMLAVGANSNAQIIPATGVSGGSSSSGSAQGGSATGSSVSGASGARVDLLKGITDAYRTFQLDKDKNIAEIENLRANTENTNAKTITEGYNQKLIDAETQFKFIEKALRSKDLEWYDKMRLVESKSLLINALANETSANAAAMNATTSRFQYKLDKKMMSYERDKQKLEKQWRKENPGQAKWTTGIGQWTGALGNIFAGAGSRFIKK